MNIRKAVPDDALGIAKAHVDSWRSAYRGVVPDDRLARMDYARGAERFRQSIAQEKELMYVAEDAIGIVGFFALGPCRDSGIDSTATAEVYALYLAPEHWRKGVGRMMTREAERILGDHGYSRLVLWVFEGNTRGRLFYEAMGFVADGAMKTMDVGAPVNCMRYGKDM